MSHAEWTAPAEQDVEDIYGWIAVRDGRLQTAKAILRSIRESCDECAKLFASGSAIGTSREDLGDGYRLLTHQRWVIVFRPIENGIEVQRVIDGSRDFDHVFGQ
jgi:toxin ParE1/3/4